MKRYTKLDLADAQFIGFHHGLRQSLISMVISMGLTEGEWIKWRQEYPNGYLTDSEISEVDEHFKQIKYENRQDR